MTTINKLKEVEAHPVVNSKSHIYYPIQPLKHQAQVTNYENKANHQIERVREKEISLLKKTNQQLRDREDIYIDKLMKLEEGLENQHTQFIKLQELYTQLFKSYKEKESEIEELQLKFRESDRYRETDRSHDHHPPRTWVEERQLNRVGMSEEMNIRQVEYSNKQSEWLQRERVWQQKQKDYLSQLQSLNVTILRMNENHEMTVQQLNFCKSKNKLNNSRAAVAQESLDEMQELQKTIDLQKENRFKFQYENQFLKTRNQDLQAQRDELEELLTFKQNQITKLREQKIQSHRKSSEQLVHRTSAKIKQSRLEEKTVEDSVEDGRLRQGERQSFPHSLSTERQNLDNYFSFSRSREKGSESELPSFPPELQINQLINVHRK